MIISSGICRFCRRIEWFTLMPFETGFLVRFPDPAKTGEASAGGTAQKNQQGISGADALVPADAGAERGGAEPHDCRGEIR